VLQPISLLTNLFPVILVSCLNFLKGCFKVEYCQMVSILSTVVLYINCFFDCFSMHIVQSCPIKLEYIDLFNTGVISVMELGYS